MDSNPALVLSLLLIFCQNQGYCSYKIVLESANNYRTYQLWVTAHWVNGAESLGFVIAIWCWCCAQSFQLYPPVLLFSCEFCACNFIENETLAVVFSWELLEFSQLITLLKTIIQHWCFLVNSACNFIKNKTLGKTFFWEFWEFFQPASLLKTRLRHRYFFVDLGHFSTCNSIKSKVLTQVFACELCKIFQPVALLKTRLQRKSFANN